jgi:hypothetical protein
VAQEPNGRRETTALSLEGRDSFARGDVVVPGEHDGQSIIRHSWRVLPASPHALSEKDVAQ